MAEKGEAVRVLALVPIEMQAEIRCQLAPTGVEIDFIRQAAELSHLVLSQSSYHVAIVPAALADSSWWSLWGEIAVLNPRPEILVYAHTASFQLWSGVLDLGGYDVIVEPFTDEELRGAVLRAAQSFKQRTLAESQ